MTFIFGHGDMNFNYPGLPIDGICTFWLLCVADSFLKLATELLFHYPFKNGGNVYCFNIGTYVAWHQINRIFFPIHQWI